MDENDVLKTYLNSDSDTFAASVGSLMLVELGIIMEVSSEGRASIQLMRLAAGRVIVLDDIELLFPGNCRGGAFTNCAGSLCLLVCPRTSVEDTRSRLVRAELPTTHAHTGIKAIPLSNLYRGSVNVDFTGDGAFIIGTGKSSIKMTMEGAIRAIYDNYGVTIDEEGVALFTSGGPTYLKHNPDGSILEYQWNEKKPVYLRIREVDGTEKIFRNGFEDATNEQREDISTYEKWQWEEDYNADGTHVTTLYNSDGDIIYSLTKQPDGSDDTNSTSPWSVVVTDSDGKEQVTLKATNDGKLDITTEDAVSITAKGDVSVTTDGAVNIEATKQGLLTLKNSVDSLGKIIEAIIDNMNTFSQNVQSIDTVGSPASHSAGPGIIANMINLQAQLNQLKQKSGQVLG